MTQKPGTPREGYSGQLRALGLPRPVQVEADALGIPETVSRLIGRHFEPPVAVAQVEEIWRIADEWWRGEDTTILRTYFRVTLENGRNITLFHDDIHPDSEKPVRESLPRDVRDAEPHDVPGGMRTIRPHDPPGDSPGGSRRAPPGTRSGKASSQSAAGSAVHGGVAQHSHRSGSGPAISTLSGWYEQRY